QRIALFKAHFSDLLLAIPFLFVPMIPQLLYWKEMVGHWVTYSYEGEGFIYWQHPKIPEVLFDTEDGLFLYAPILLFSVLGLIIWRKDKRTNSIGMSIVFAIITYVFASWWQWSFGAAYGQRCYIEYLPFLAFPMAVAFERIVASKYYAVKIPVALVVGLFI